MKRNVWIRSAIAIVVAGALTAIGLGFYAFRMLQPVQPAGPEVHISVLPGMGAGEIAELLENNGIIRDAFMFKLYLKSKGEGSRFQAGEYAMAPGMSLEQIVKKLNNGETVKEETVRFVIPEGFTVTQIADRLSEQNGFDRDHILQIANEKAAFSSRWTAEIPDDPRIRYRLEGYLFPETYEMHKGASEREIVERMVKELDNKLAQLPADWPDRLKQSGLTFHQMLTLASLVEREVAVDYERPIVAGVIYNRLKRNMLLQIDATVLYALGQSKERVDYKDLEIDSPYNTYRYPGLPPGPIANPGLASIRAALYPAETNYLFYVTKKDGTHEHYFAETLEQHLQNIAKSEKR